MPYKMPLGDPSEPAERGPAMEVHQVAIRWESNQSRWLARCTCGWRGNSRTRVGIELDAASHDIREWGK